MNNKANHSQGVLLFKLNSRQLFAMGTLKVKELVRYSSMSRLPNSHDTIIGTATIRNRTVPIVDMAKAVSEKSKIVFSGIRPGEKIHEEMISEGESRNCIEYKNFYIIKPETKFSLWNLDKFNKKNKLKNIKLNYKNIPYKSDINENFIKLSELKKIIKS